MDGCIELPERACISASPHRILSEDPMPSRIINPKVALSIPPKRIHEQLYNFSNIVKFSFIVQKSLVPLNLEICNFCLQRGEKNTDTRSYFNPFPPKSNSNIYISTEESCRKYFWEDRRIVFDYNLDISKQVEQSLRENLPKSSLQTNSPCLNKLSIAMSIDKCVLHKIDMYASKNPIHKIKFLKLLLKLRKVVHQDIEAYCIKYSQSFLQHLRHKSNDSNLVKGLLNMIDFEAWLVDNEDPELLEDLLYHIRQSGYNLRRGIEHRRDFVNECLVNYKFLDVKPYLKYKNSPRFTCESYKFLKKKLRSVLMGSESRKAEFHLGKKRSLLLFQILWCFYNRDELSSSTALRLIWDAIPDAYISLREFVLILAEFSDPITINRIYCFYIKAIGKRSDITTPRSLQHYCRSTIRRTLGQKKLWMPDAINKLELPEKLKAFVNLE